MFAKIWRLVTAPTFDVKTTTNHTTVAVIAGQRTKICTIIISLNADALLGRRQEKIDFPRPYFREPGVEVSYEDSQPRREVLEIDVYVRVTLVGTYSITPNFREDDCNFSSMARIPVKFYVRPSELYHLKLTSIAPFPGNGRDGKVYRGGTAKICVKGSDEFGNKTVVTDLKFNIFPNLQSVVLVSSTRDFDNGTYVVTLRCDEVGVNSFDIISPDHHQVLRVADFKIIPPPVSVKKSYIIQNDVEEIQKRIHEAGKTITLKLELYDIFANPISCNESVDFINMIHLVSHGESPCPDQDQDSSGRSVFMEKNSLKVRPHDFNICEVEFTPFIKGNRWFSLIADGKMLKNSMIKLNINPGPLKALQIVSQKPASFKDVYRGDTAEIWVNATDKYGNIYAGNDVNIDIFSKGSFVNLLSVNDSNDSEQGSHEIIVRWDRAGETSFDLIASQGNHEVKKDIPVKIIPPPVSEINSFIIPSDLDEIQKRIHEAGKDITFNLQLIDILGNPISFEESGDFVDNINFVLHKDSYPHCSCSDEFTNTDSESLKREVESLRVCTSAVVSNACEFSFTPFIAGKRRLSIKAGKHTLENTPVKVTVIPSDGGKVQVLENPHVCQMPEMPLEYKVEDYLEFYEYDQKILCMGVVRRKLIGEDNANIKNINRVLEKEYPNPCRLSKDLLSREYGLFVLFDVSGLLKDTALRVFDLLSLLVEGAHHYRKQAHEFGEHVRKYGEDAFRAFEAKDFSNAGLCKRTKEEYVELMKKSHWEASDAIFKFYNYGRPQSEIDLHGLLVADSAKLKERREQLLGRGKSSEEVNAIIERERNKRDEAIRKLDERLSTFDHEEAKRIGEDWLGIIDGAGHHSATKGQQKIRPKVQEYLKNKNIKYVEANEGALLVTFSEYTGKEPCVADFYCRTCNRTWTSISSWKGFFQRCYKCDSKGNISNCYPFKLRSVLPERRKQNDDLKQEDHRKLCQKCIQLRADCRRLR